MAPDEVARRWTVRGGGSALTPKQDGAMTVEAAQRRDKGIDIALAEFNALRALAATRFQMQLTLLVATFTAAGLIAGFVVKDGGDTNLLLLIPLLASSVGILFNEQARRVAVIGDYINERLWPYLRRRTDDELPSWETWAREQGPDLLRKSNVLLAIGEAPAVLLIPSVSVVSLVFAAPDALGGAFGYASLWVLGALITAANVAFPFVWMVPRARRRQKPRPPN
jgi:hypothetical protein